MDVDIRRFEYSQLQFSIGGAVRRHTQQRNCCNEKEKEWMAVFHDFPGAAPLWLRAA
jgi:hypothetical protein